MLQKGVLKASFLKLGAGSGKKAVARLLAGLVETEQLGYLQPSSLL